MMIKTKTLFAFVITCLSYSGHCQPKLEIKDAKKNFGFVKKGEVVKIEYEVKNSGDQPLIFTGVEISCSCTTVDYPKQPVAPLQEAKVTVLFDTKTVYDRQDRTVELQTNDPESPHKIRYKGIVLNK